MSILKIIYFVLFFFIVRGLFRYLLGYSQKLPPAGRTNQGPLDNKKDMVVDVKFSRKKDQDHL